MILMSASAERPERLAEILREILGLSNPSRTNDPGPERTDEAIESSDVQSVNPIDEGDASRGNEAHQEYSGS
jgi:hypothetical protein